MQVTCYPREVLGSCLDCPDRKECTVYHLLMDMSGERMVCPLNPSMERCLADGSRQPKHVGECFKLGDWKEG